MNSKKKLAAFCFMFFFILIQNISFAQTLTGPWQTPGAFNITLPSLSALNPGQTIPAPFYTYFLEYGNGRYIKVDDHIYGESDTRPYSYPIPSNPNAAVVLNLVGHYDPIPPPIRQLSIQPVPYNGNRDLPNQNYLVADEKVGLDYSTTTVVPGDTMTVAIVYKPDLQNMKPYATQPPNGNYIIALFYNNDNTGGKVFHVIDDPELTFQFSGNSTKAIRKYFNETIYTSINDIPHTGIPEAVFTNLAAAKSGYANALYFKIPNGLSADEKNIFISMAPDVLNNNNYNNGMATSIATAIIKYNNTVPLAQQYQSRTLGIDLAARDPNGITTRPSCLNRQGEDVILRNDIPISYFINFKNTGRGPAKDVKITMNLPDGITIPSSLSAICRVKGQLKSLQNASLHPTALYTYRITADQKIIFTLKNIQLEGTANPSHNETLRRGSISFTLRTYGNPQPRRVPDCMYSTISIVFTNTNGSDNPPFTAYDRVRVFCDPGMPCPLEAVLGGQGR